MEEVGVHLSGEAAARGPELGLHRHRRVEVVILEDVRTAKARRGDSENDVRPPVDEDLASDHPGIGTVPPAPQTMAQNHHRVRSGLPIVLGGEKPTEARSNPKNVEEVPGRDHSPLLLRRDSVRGETDGDFPVGGEPAEGETPIAIVEVVRMGNRAIGAFPRAGEDEHQLLRRAHGRRPKKSGVHDEEHRNRDADPGRDREDGGRREQWAPPPEADAVAKVLPDGFDHFLLFSCEQGSSRRRTHDGLKRSIYNLDGRSCKLRARERSMILRFGPTERDNS
jgi:hypothetical protein